MNTATYNTELIMPERSGRFAKREITGYLCRAALAFICLYGFAVFINNALALEISSATQFIICAAFCIFFSIMGISKRYFFCGLLISGGAFAYALFKSERFVEKVFYFVYSLINAFYRRLAVLGYKSANKNILNFEYAEKKLNLSESDCRMYAFIAVMFILAAVIFACILKRVHIFPLVLVGGSVCTLFLYYGMSSSNTGFAIIIASLCGCIALLGYDRIYSHKKTIIELTPSLSGKTDRSEFKSIFRHNSSLGGFTGLASALLALALLLIPAGVKTSMEDIPAISVPAMKIENYLISVANGHNPDFSSLIFSGVTSLDKRDTATGNRTYTGERVFEVRVDTTVPIYIRSWVGIDYYNDSWHSADYDRIGEYKQMFGENFSPELLNSELINAINPSLIGLPDGTSYKDRTELGYVTAAVNIKKLQPTANLVFLPSYTDQNLGLLEFATRNKSNVSYSIYYDGIYTSTSYLFMDEYATIANLPLLRDPNFAKNISHIASQFVTESRIISAIRKLISENAQQRTIDAVFLQQSMAYSNSNLPKFIPTGENALSYRYTYSMSQEERNRIDTLIDSVEKYNYYVYKNYLSGCEEFSEFQKLARNIIYDDMPDYLTDSYTARHKIVMTIIDYLSENMKYTLTPENPSDTREYINAAETFLFDTQEGYCVQFATSAVMLLRSLGIPARYAEGYITGEYSRLPNHSLSGRYSSILTDSNAHAWIEVYYDYYGWVQYEATTPYYSDMYESPAIQVSQNTRDQDYESYYPEENTDESPIITSPVIINKSKDVNKFLLITVITVVIVLSGAVAFVYIRSERASERRNLLIQSAKNGSLDSANRLAAASKLDAGILRLLAFNKLIPQSGEQHREFAARVDEKLGPISAYDFTRVSEAMLAGEFGTDIPRSKLAEIAVYYDDLIRGSIRESKFFKRLWLKYIYLD